MKKFLFFIISACLFIVVFWFLSNGKVISSSDKVYEIKKVMMLKNLYVDIVDVKSGHVYTTQYVAIYCKGWRQIKVGSPWTFKEVVYEGLNGHYIKISGLNSLCTAFN